MQIAEKIIEEEQAIIDEAAFIKNELSECKELLVLADF